MQLKFMARLCACALALVGLAGAASAEEPDHPDFVIGTGIRSGVYFPVGGAICRRFNAAHGAGCRISESEGSLDNLYALQLGLIDVAIVQSDAEHDAFVGIPGIDLEPMTNLRSLFSLYVEALAILVRADAGIGEFSDLDGKRLNAGPSRSGSHQTFLNLARAYDFDVSKLDRLDTSPPEEALDELCMARLDAVLYVSGHPSAVIREATRKCDISLLPLSEAVTTDMTRQRPYYVTVTIPGGLYHGAEEGTRTIGTRATLVSRNDLPDTLAHRLAETVFADWTGFADEHPALEAFTDQVRAGPEGSEIVPMHPGAARYFE